MSLRILPRSLLRLPRTQSRTLSTTPRLAKGDQNETPGYEGRYGDDHALHRDGKYDAQSVPSVQARSEKAEGKEGSSAISEKDEENANTKAKQETKAPGPVIGMNDERGQKGGAE